MTRSFKDLEQDVDWLKQIIRAWDLDGVPQDFRAITRAWVPVTHQNGVRSNTVTFARYAIVGKLAVVQAEVVLTQAGSAGSIITVSGLPAAIQHVNANASIGSVCGSFKYDDTGTANYSGVAVALSADSTAFVVETGSGGGWLGIAPSLATANGDILSFVLMYEIA